MAADKFPQSQAEAVWAKLQSWPEGYFVARFNGRRYGVRHSVHAGGRSRKLFGEELGGTDFISLNIYRTGSGEPALKPCEMPVDTVTAFVLGAEHEP